MSDLITNLREIVTRNADRNYAICTTTVDMRALLDRVDRMRSALIFAHECISGVREDLIDSHGGEDDLDPLAVDGRDMYDEVLEQIRLALGWPKKATPTDEDLEWAIKVFEGVDSDGGETD